MDAALQILKLIASYRQTLLRGVVVSSMLLVLGEFPIDSYRSTQCSVLQISNGILCLFIIGWAIAAHTDRNSHLAWRIGLKGDRYKDFVQAMGLLSRANNEQLQLTQTLQDRALEPWGKPITRVCHVRNRVLLILLLQLSCVVGIWSVVLSKPRLIPNPNQATEQVSSAVVKSTDIQQTTTTLDQLAHDLLQMRDQLDAITEQVSDDQLQQVISLVNETWQGINVRLASMSQDDQSQFGQLESARSLPITKGQSIKSASARKTLRDTLAKDINTLASQGARFDGPGMISQGQSNVPDTSAAKGAQGRYDELVDRGNSSTALPVNRRMEQVPPSLRKAVTRYLAGQTDAQKKAHKGVEP